MTRPAPSKPRAFLFNVLWLIAVAGNLVVSVLDYIVWSKGAIGEHIYHRLVGSGWGHYAVAGGAAALAAIVVPAAYLASLDRRRGGRPVVRLYLLWLGLAFSLAGYLLGTAGVGPDNYPVIVGSAVLVLLFPLIPIWLESVLGQGKIRAAERMLRAGRPGAALPIVRLGLVFQPGDPAGERVYGLALSRRGREAQARPYLEDAYARGDRSPDLLLALAGAEEAEGDFVKAARLLEELQAVQPAPEHFERLIRLWLATGQEETALVTLQRLSPDERLAWGETLQNLLFARRDVQGLVSLAAEMEKDGPPFNRSRICFERLLELAPEDPVILEAAADLWERAGDRVGALNLLERLAALENPPRPELLRRLAAHYEAQGRAGDALRRRAQLVEVGAATLNEKLMVVDDLFSRGEYDKVISLIANDEVLRSHGRAACTLAFALYESGRSEAALEQAAAARAQNPPEDLAAELSSMEASIRAQRLSGELAALAARVEAEPDNLDLRFEYLDRLAASRAMDRVVVLLEELLAQRPELRSRVTEEVTAMLERHGPAARLISYLADLHLRQGEWDAAYELAEKVAAASLHSAEVLHSWTLKILRGNPEHTPSLLSEARFSLATGDPVTALARLDQYACYGGERTPEVMRLELDAAQGAGQLERADAVGQELLALDPDDLELKLRLAKVASDRKDYTVSLDRLKAVAEVEPERPGLQLLIRRTEEQEKEARIEAIRTELAGGAQNPDLREEMGDLLHDLGRLNEALVEYQRAAHAGPERNVARAKLAYVLARKSLYSDAEEALARTELSPEQPAEEQGRLKALFYRTAELMQDDHEEARALSLYKRIFNVDAGYNDVLARIEHLQRLAEKKRKR